MDYDDIPWHDTKNWKAGFWYPLPETSCWCRSLSVVEGYGIFQLDTSGESAIELGDITPVMSPLFIFKDAVRICEEHNKEGFLL